jgi:signal transduction histidine kinase
VRQVASLARRLNIRWIDVGLATGLTIWAILEAAAGNSAGFSVGVLLTTLPLLVRRRWPVAVLALAIAGFGIAGNASGLASLIGGLTACVSVGLYSRHQNAAVVAVIASAAFVALEFGRGDSSTLPVPGYLLPFLLLGAAYLAGREIGSRRNALDAQRERSAQIEREHETAIKAAAAAERQHIARELHDVVAHSVSVMVVQAGAARQVMADKPDAARESLLNVESVGHAAMAELRRLLGVLGTNGNEAPLAPQPGMSGLDALLERMRDAGLPVEVKVSGEPAVLPPGVDVAAFRIIQEALTNALKYAGGAPTRVGVSYASDAVDIEVIDDGALTTPADGIGRGLAGMRERVALFGGRVDAGTRPGGGYAVRAHLPLDPAS